MKKNKKSLKQKIHTYFRNKIKNVNYEKKYFEEKEKVEELKMQNNQLNLKLKKNYYKCLYEKKVKELERQIKINENLRNDNLELFEKVSK